MPWPAPIPPGDGVLGGSKLNKLLCNVFCGCNLTGRGANTGTGTGEAARAEAIIGGEAREADEAEEQDDGGRNCIEGLRGGGEGVVARGVDIVRSWSTGGIRKAGLRRMDNCASRGRLWVRIAVAARDVQSRVLS